MKPGPIHILKTIQVGMNSMWTDHRHDTKIQNTFIYILNATDTICRENWIFMGSSKFINQEI